MGHMPAPPVGVHDVPLPRMQQMAQARPPTSDQLQKQPVLQQNVLQDAKTTLNQFCQRLCQRPVTKGDIEYSVNKIGTQFQAVVKLNCIQGQEFAGELAVSAKDAEKAAAEQAIKAHRLTIDQLPSTPLPKKKKEKSQGEAEPQPGESIEEMRKRLLVKAKVKEPGEENPALTDKVRLNTFCMRVVKRALQKGEMLYDTKQAQGGFHTTVQLRCLPGQWSEKMWSGKVCTTKQGAEQSAASYALETLQADAELNSLLDKETTSKTEGKLARGKGKGRGKGKFDVKGALKGMMLPPWMQVDRPTGPDLERELVESNEPATGEVISFQKNYGWIKLDQSIEHPKMSRHGGKIYLHCKDVECDLEALQAGTKVQFTLYADDDGLGAQQVSLL